ncbi:MAG: hypothetical protein QOK40_2422 [Miltoncostaeaceae bacterium]|nr:hypothetical protein [Miltoncostaeaceae bacterium]
MPGFEERALCRAPAEEVWKLLHDPARYPEWWDGVERMEAGADGLTRYTEAYPDFAYPTHVATHRRDGRVVISCLLSDIVHEWSLEPAPQGCAVRIRVEIPEAEAARLESLQENMSASLVRLVARAEAA